MFQSVRTVTYRVPDLEAAKGWYSQFLGQNPAFDSPMAVVFAGGGSAITLIPAGNSLNDDERAVVYWNVADIDATYQRLLDSGATPRSEIVISALRSRIARVVDPFGNVIGISSNLGDAAKGSLQERPSDSAVSVALCRALAALDPRPEIRGPDHLAEIFLAADIRKLLSQPSSREHVTKQMRVSGTYEFFVARTAHLDGVVRQALEDNIPQIVILGAGYDSRPYRFRDLIRQTRIYEVDAAPTQQRKRRLLEEANVAVPPEVTFVAVDFVRDKLEDVLPESFDRSARTLFIWEGVLYYLPAAAVDQTLEFVRTNSALGSAICFDYLVDAPDIMERHGVREALTAMRAMYQAEPIQFRIPEGPIRSFSRNAVSKRSRFLRSTTWRRSTCCWPTAHPAAGAWLASTL